MRNWKTNPCFSFFLRCLSVRLVVGEMALPHSFWFIPSQKLLQHSDTGGVTQVTAVTLAVTQVWNE